MSLRLSSTSDVLVMWESTKPSPFLYLSNTAAIRFPRSFFLNSACNGRSEISLRISAPIGRNSESGVATSAFALASLTYGKSAGRAWLKMILPTVVTRYLPFCSSVKHVLPTAFAGTAILECRWTTCVSYAIRISLISLKT